MGIVYNIWHQNIRVAIIMAKNTIAKLKSMIQKIKGWGRNSAILKTFYTMPLLTSCHLGQIELKKRKQRVWKGHYPSRDKARIQWQISLYLTIISNRLDYIHIMSGSVNSGGRLVLSFVSRHCSFAGEIGSSGLSPHYLEQVPR